MTTEFFYLTLTSLLLASLWIPHIVGVNMHGTPRLKDFSRPPDKSGLPNWVLRADRAHLNLVEQFAPYAVLLLVLHLIGISNHWTQGAATAFFWLRIAHAVGMISGWAVFPIRPIIFTAAWACVVVLGIQVFQASPV